MQRLARKAGNLAVRDGGGARWMRPFVGRGRGMSSESGIMSKLSVIATTIVYSIAGPQWSQESCHGGIWWVVVDICVAERTAGLKPASVLVRLT